MLKAYCCPNCRVMMKNNKSGNSCVKKYTDELLLKEVIEEMGLVWDEAEGCITVNGISAVEFLSSNNIFERKHI